MDLQEALPNARIVYASATGATGSLNVQTYHFSQYYPSFKNP